MVPFLIGKIETPYSVFCVARLQLCGLSVCHSLFSLTPLKLKTENNIYLSEISLITLRWLDPWFCNWGHLQPKHNTCTFAVTTHMHYSSNIIHS